MGVGARTAVCLPFWSRAIRVYMVSFPSADFCKRPVKPKLFQNDTPISSTFQPRRHSACQKSLRVSFLALVLNPAGSQDSPWDGDCKSLNREHSDLRAAEYSQEAATTLKALNPQCFRILAEASFRACRIAVAAAHPATGHRPTKCRGRPVHPCHAASSGFSG